MFVMPASATGQIRFVWPPGCCSVKSNVMAAAQVPACRLQPCCAPTRAWSGNPGSSGRTETPLRCPNRSRELRACGQLSRGAALRMNGTDARSKATRVPEGTRKPPRHRGCPFIRNPEGRGYFARRLRHCGARVPLGTRRSLFLSDAQNTRVAAHDITVHTP